MYPTNPLINNSLPQGLELFTNSSTFGIPVQLNFRSSACCLFPDQIEYVCLCKLSRYLWTGWRAIRSIFDLYKSFILLYLSNIIIQNRVCAFANWRDACGYFADWRESNQICALCQSQINDKMIPKRKMRRNDRLYPEGLSAQERGKYLWQISEE